jgi:osmotically-inducible protein OsmY
MNRSKQFCTCAYLGAVVCGLSGFAMLVSAQNAAAATQNASAMADKELGERVQGALHADPYFYDEHVSVSVEKHAIVLRGFVFSDWDLRDAIRIAGKAAGGRRVIDDLSIELGGRR